MSENIQELKSQKSAATARMSWLERKLAEYEKAYDSLSRFKRMVQSSEERIQATNVGNIRSMQSLESVQLASCTAERYIDGTDSLLNGVGAKIVGVAINALQITINVKLAFYRAQIHSCETQISIQKKTISAIAESIEKLSETLESITL